MGDFFKNLVIPRYNNNYFPFLLRKRFLAIVTILILGFNIATGGGQLGTFAGDVNAATLIALTNQERVAAGLNQLTADSRLTAAAQAKAENMFQLQYWAHYGPNGETPWQFIIAAGYNYILAGENLAKGFNSSEAVHSAWMASQTHRENILKVGYQDIGIAVVSGNLLGSDVLLVVQMFGSTSQAPAPMPPPVEPPAEPPVNQPSVPTSKPSEKPVVEITTPTEGDRLSNDEFMMEGRTNKGSDSVIVNDGEEEGIGTVGEDGIWDYRPEGNWKEGWHAVTVWNEGKTVSSSVNFEIDTTAPVIDESSVALSRNLEDRTVTIKAKVDETALNLFLVTGEKSMTFEKKKDGSYEITVPDSEILGVSDLKLVSTDDLGNSSELAVASKFGFESAAGVREEVPSFKDKHLSLSDGEIARLVTRGAVVAIAILLIVDAAYLYRLNIIHTRGKSLFPMAIWIILMGIGLAIGRGGSVL